MLKFNPAIIVEILKRREKNGRSKNGFAGIKSNRK